MRLPQLNLGRGMRPTCGERTLPMLPPSRLCTGSPSKSAGDSRGSSSNPSLNDHLHYPDDTDRTLNEDVVFKILQYRADYIAQTNFHFRRVVFSSQLKSKVGHILVKAAALRIMLNIDGSPIASRSHTHPSHTQNSRLLTSSLSLGVPVPHTTQCIRDT